MKHPVRDRLIILLFSVLTLACAAGAAAFALGKLPIEWIYLMLEKINPMTLKRQIALIAAALILAALGLALFSAILPAKRKRSSTFAIQRNENGMVRISLKALESLVQKCLNQHAELKVVTSSLFSDEESIRVDVHIALQSDISMPLAISALQKQIKKYLEACSGVMVQEVRVFVDSTIPATEETAKSPYSIPAGLLGMDAEPQALAAETQKPAENASVQNEETGMPEEEAADETIDETEPEAKPENAEPDLEQTDRAEEEV